MEGGRIVLAPAQGDSEPIYIEMPVTGGSVSESAALLAQELQEDAAHASEILSRFFEQSLNSSAGIAASDASRQTAMEIWLDMEQRARKVLKIRIRKGKTKEWKKETAAILRNSPGLSLEKALAQSFAKVHGLSLKKKQRLEELFLKGGRFILDLDPVGIVRGVASFDGRLYAGAHDAVFMKKSEKWKQVFTGLGTVYRFDRMDGKVYAQADGLYAQEKGGWVKEKNDWLRGFGIVERLVELDGQPYVVTLNHGAYVRKGQEWEPAFKELGEIYFLAQLNGEIYAKNRNGLYVRKGKGWRLFFKTKERINDLAWLDGKFYAATPNGLYEKGKGKWKISLKDIVVFQVVGLGGEIYAGSLYGLYKRKGGKPKRKRADIEALAEKMSRGDRDVYADLLGSLEEAEAAGWDLVFEKQVNSIAELNGSVYLGTDSGLYRWFTLPSGWEKQVLGSISREIALAQKSREKEALGEPPQPFFPDEKGNILGEDGRTIFGGLQRTSAFLLGMLGAGVLEGLSRLALSLGNLNLGFDAAAAEESGETPEKDIWPALEGWINRQLNLQLSASRAAEWRKEAADILRNAPAASLKKTLAEAFVRTHPSADRRREDIDSLLSKKPLWDALKKRVGKVEQIIPIDGNLYAATQAGVYVKNGDDWELELPVPWALSILKADGKIHAATQEGIYAKTGDGWNPVLTEVGQVFQLIEADERVYAAGRKGIYVKEGEAWKPEFLDGGSVYQIIQADGRLYAAAEKGVYVKQGNKWELLPPGLEYVPHLLYADGKLYAATEKSVYVRENNVWRSKIFDAGWIRQLFQIDGKVYAATRRGIYTQTEKSSEWMPEFPELGSGRGHVWVEQIVKAGDNIYAATEEGLYRREGDHWVAELSNIGWVHHIAEWDGKLYLSTDSGLLCWNPALKRPEDAVLADILQTIDSAQELKSQVLDSSRALQADKKGNIIGGDGRTIFSGLQGGNR